MLAIRDLLELAVSDPRVTYIHIISGQDILLRDYSEFERFFSGSQKIYMTCTSMKDAPDDIKRRLENWIPFSNIDCRKKTVSYINDVFYSVQRFLHITRKRLGMFDDIYKGMVWCSFPVSVARYVIEYNATHKEFLNDLKHTQIPEEFFFQTIIMNSSYKENVVKRNLRYTDWSGKNGSNPSFLDETDYEAIIGSTSFFARKIDLVISEKLLNKIMRERQCS